MKDNFRTEQSALFIIQDISKVDVTSNQQTDHTALQELTDPLINKQSMLVGYVIDLTDLKSGN